jgi:hypothetical protein
VSSELFSLPAPFCLQVVVEVRAGEKAMTLRTIRGPSITKSPDV